MSKSKQPAGHCDSSGLRQIEREPEVIEARSTEPPWSAYSGMNAEDVTAMRELEARGSQQADRVPKREPKTIKFIYADSTPAELTHAELSAVQHSIANDFRNGNVHAAERGKLRAALEDCNELAREAGLPEVHI